MKRMSMAFYKEIADVHSLYDRPNRNRTSNLNRRAQ